MIDIGADLQRAFDEGYEKGKADRPQGEWIVSDKDSVCSVCGKDEAEFICGTEDWYGYGLSNYCPNCGARMKGADDVLESDR